MLYTEDFTMRHYVGFLQIGSHIKTFLLLLLPAVAGQYKVCNFIVCV